MNNIDIQKLLDSPQSLGAVKLPSGEFEGPFVISRPCVITGNNTTLWRREGTVLKIRSRGVKLENIQIENTVDAESEPVLTNKAPDFSAENVIVYGRTEGVPADEGFWGLPKVLAPGKIKPGEPFEMIIEIETAAKTKVVCNISGVSASPSEIPKGRSQVKLRVEPLSAGTIIYGDIEFRSFFTRKSYLNLSADNDSTCRSGEVIFVSPAPPAALPPRASSSVLNTAQNNAVRKTAPVQPPEITVEVLPKNTLDEGGRLIRGQRVNVKDILGSGEITAELFYTSMDCNLDIDAYTFLLDESGKAQGDDSLIFFGNKSSTNNAVCYNDDGRHRIVHINPDKLPRDIQNISIAYSIYGDDPRNNFSKLHGGIVVFRCGEKTAEFPLEGLFMETTVVAASLYRRGDIWKLCAVGQGYKNGLKPLCESFGLNIMDN